MPAEPTSIDSLTSKIIEARFAADEWQNFADTLAALVDSPPDLPDVRPAGHTGRFQLPTLVSKLPELYSLPETLAGRLTPLIPPAYTIAMAYREEAEKLAATVQAARTAEHSSQAPRPGVPTADEGDK